MSLPVVAIVGRPNVGKSSLLNCIAREMIGIVDPTPGVTRDRVSAVCNTDETYFELVDTGGFGIEDHDQLAEHVETQIRYAIAQANLVLFVVDVREGLVPLDQDVARLLRTFDRDVVLVGNKVDQWRMEAGLGEFNKLGFGVAQAVSAHQGLGRRELLETIARRIAPLGAAAAPEPVLKIAVVGKRNSGKSTFINAIAGEPRLIVSEVPGTTRDAVDVRFEKDGKTFVIIDTAGVRKKSKMSTSIEFYSFVRASRAIHRADVVLMFIEATESVGQVDKKLACFISEEAKPCILVVSKWDLAKGRAATDDYQKYFTKTLPELNYAPISVISAKDHRGLQPTIELAQALFKQAQTRVTTAQLNQVLESALAKASPSAQKGGKAVKIYYATQVATRPPTVVLFVNHPGRIREDYERFLVNRFREMLPFAEIPIRLIFRSHRQQKKS